MTNVVEIPLRPSGQKLAAQLGSREWQVTVRWCNPAQCWVADFATPEGVRVACGIALTAGSDLLGQLQHLGFAGSLVALSDDGSGPPDYAGLGTTGHLYFLAAP